MATRAPGECTCNSDELWHRTSCPMREEFFPEEYAATLRPLSRREQVVLYTQSITTGVVLSAAFTFVFDGVPWILRTVLVALGVLGLQWPLRMRYERRRAREAGRPVKTTRLERRAMRRDLEAMARELRD